MKNRQRIITLILMSLLMITAVSACAFADDNNNIIIISSEPQLSGASAYTKTAVIKTQENSAANAPALHQDISNALKKQGLSEYHLGLWRQEHPKSTLNELHNLSPEFQRKVAVVSAYIRKSNRQISAKTAWREACALVFYSRKYNVPVDLAVGIAKTESRFTPTAASRAGALGVMQVMWRVHKKMLIAKGIAATREHLFDPEHGVEAGLLILSRYIKAYGSLNKALSGYYGSSASKRFISMVNKHSTNLHK